MRNQKDRALVLLAGNAAVIVFTVNFIRDWVIMVRGYPYPYEILTLIMTAGAVFTVCIAMPACFLALAFADRAQVGPNRIFNALQLVGGVPLVLAGFVVVVFLHRMATNQQFLAGMSQELFGPNDQEHFAWANDQHTESAPNVCYHQMKDSSFYYMIVCPGFTPSGNLTQALPPPIGQSPSTPN